MGQQCTKDRSGLTVEGAIKYYYFGMAEGNNLKARGLAILCILEEGKVPYQGVVVTADSWFTKMTPEDKHKMSPFGYLASIELPDGTKITETTACLQMAGQLAGMNGKTAAEFGVSNMLACKSAEMFSEMTSKGPTVLTVAGYDQKKHDEYKTWEKGARESLGKFETLCKADGTFTANGPVSGEFALWSLLHQAKSNGFFKTGVFPKLDKFVLRMEALPGIKLVLGGKSQMGEQLDYVAAIPDSVN